MLAPSVPQVLSTFRPDGSDKSLGSFCVTVYILGFCVGPLLLAPLTDIYGRTTLYRIYIVAYTALTVSCALSPNLEALIVFRFFSGCFGGAPMAIGGAVIADMYPPGKRAGPMACYSAGTMLGPTLSPVLGGVITGRLGWRRIFWIAAILVSLPNELGATWRKLNSDYVLPGRTRSCRLVLCAPRNPSSHNS
jgi:multidrug resistance protein